MKRNRKRSGLKLPWEYSRIARLRDSNFPQKAIQGNTTQTKSLCAFFFSVLQSRHHAAYYSADSETPEHLQREHFQEPQHLWRLREPSCQTMYWPDHRLSDLRTCLTEAPCSGNVEWQHRWQGNRQFGSHHAGRSGHGHQPPTTGAAGHGNLRCEWRIQGSRPARPWRLSSDVYITRFSGL